MCYQATMRIARQWLCSGLITAEDYEKFDTIVAEKFGVSARSIWRDINLIKLPSDGNMSNTDIAAAEGVTEAAVRNRLKKIQERFKIFKQ